MAPTGKKTTYVAPGKLGLLRGTRLKASFLPRMLAKSPSTATMSKNNQVPSMPTTVSQLYQGDTDEASVEKEVIMSISNRVSNVPDEATKAASIIQEEETNLTTRKRNRRPNAKPRGVNKCKKVANLKAGQKLEVDFYMGGAVGDNHKDLTRHMGKLVRDRSCCPVRVHSWDEIDGSAKEHMWQSVLNKFVGKGFELDRTTCIDHMKRLWQNWRGILMQNSIIKKGGLENALNETPNDLTPEDWKWLVEEHFSSRKFKKLSSRNSSNRENLTMLPRTGSTPFRQVIWEDMGGKEGNDLPPLFAVFKKTREGRSGKLKETEAAKYDEIVEVETKNPSLSRFEVVETCVGPQDRGTVVCFGFVMRPKDVRGPLPTRFDLTSSLREKQNENYDLQKRMDEMEKIRQEERETYDKKMSALEDKLNMFMAAYTQQSSGANQASLSFS